MRGRPTRLLRVLPVLIAAVTLLVAVSCEQERGASLAGAPSLDGAPAESSEPAEDVASEDVAAGADADPAAAPVSESAPDSEAAPDARPPGPEPVLGVDREKGEVVIPGIFVNPTQKLEVFACHESGPLHETVVAFRVSGEKIYEALLAVGFRSPDAFWNAADEHEVRRTLGDRALLFLRWRPPGGGEPRELPAEKVIRESESGLSLSVRGFTFGARKRLMGDPPVERVPPAVEVTIGDPNRQGSISSLLFHPNDLPALTAWMPALEVDADAVGDLETLVERVAPCEVVIRRVTSEETFIDVDLAHESSPATRAGLEALRPLAREIDAAKKLHAERIGEIQRFLASAESGKGDAPGAERLVRLVRSARLDASRIHALYIRLFAAQEKLKTDRVAAMDDLEADVRAGLVARYEHGIAYEPRLAAIAVRIAELEAAGIEEGSKGALAKEALEFDRERLRIERTLHWADQHLKSTDARLVDLRENGEEILERLFVEDRLRTLGDIRKMKAQVLILAAKTDERRAKVDGSWEREKRAEILARRAKGEAREALADLELEYVKVLEESRWHENAGEGLEARSPEARGHAEKRGELDARRAELEKRIAADRERIGGDG